MKAVDIKATRDYIPECDRDNEPADQTVFELKMLSPREERLLENAVGMGESGQMFINIGDQHYLALCMGLVGVRNFVGADGKDVKISHDNTKLHGFVKPLSEKFLSTIPKEVRVELAREIIDNSGSNLGDDEVKN